MRSLVALLAALLLLLPGCSGCQQRVAKSIDCAGAKGDERNGCQEPTAKDIEGAKLADACKALDPGATPVEADLNACLGTGGCEPSKLYNGQIFAQCGDGWSCSHDVCAKDTMTVDHKPVQCWTCPTAIKQP